MEAPPPEDRCVPIPSVFHSLHDGPFQQCLICERELLESNARYIIERIFRGAEPILEYAMCLDCHGQLAQEISEESKQRLQRYFEDRFDWQRVLARSLRMTRAPYEQCLEECFLTGAKASECHERQIFAHCRGPQLVVGEPGLITPIMLSGRAVEELSEQLSEATRGWMDDFVGEHFGVSPDLIDAPEWTPLLF